jgi:hypothetical protein
MTNKAKNILLRQVVGMPEVMERFWSKVDKGHESGCWEYTGNLNSGYGRFYYKRRPLLAHRMSYLEHHGSIPDGLVIDHICRNRACCNPAHLRAVSLRTNALENSVSQRALFAQRTHCGNGHPLSGDNLIPNKKGVRLCRTCARERHRKWVEESADAVTNSDRLEAERLIKQQDVLQVSRGAAALRYMRYLDERGLLPNSLAYEHLKGSSND